MKQQHFASPGGRGNRGNSAIGSTSGTCQWNRLHLPHTYPWANSFPGPYPYVLFSGDNNWSSSCTLDSARQPRDVNVPNGSLGYDVYPGNGTRDATSQLSSPVSSQRLGHGKGSGGYMTLQCSTPPHSRCDAHSQLFTPDSQPRHGDSNCDAPSQLISLVLVTARLALLGSEIPSRQAISIPKCKMLLVSPLTRLGGFSASGCWSGSFCDIAISLSFSRQVAQWLAANLE